MTEVFSRVRCLRRDVVGSAACHYKDLTETIACENIRFSSLFAAGDVSRGGTSATQRLSDSIMMT